MFDINFKDVTLKQVVTYMKFKWWQLANPLQASYFAAFFPFYCQLGYQSEGVCFGFSMRSLEATILGETEHFNARLDRIVHYYNHPQIWG